MLWVGRVFPFMSHCSDLVGAQALSYLCYQPVPSMDNSDAPGSASQPEGASLISVSVKDAGGAVYPLRISPDASVEDLKNMLAESVGQSPQEQRLILRGNILKNERLLSSYGVSDNATIILAKPKAADPAMSRISDGRAAAGQTTNPMAALLGQGGASNMDAMFQQLESNPALSGMMNSIMANPELMRSMLTSNPMVQQLTERNPELAALLNDPELIRQSLQIARNPALQREHMRTSDRALSNIESMPEGFNALRRMFETVQEPLMEAATSQAAGGQGGLGGLERLLQSMAGQGPAGAGAPSQGSGTAAAAAAGGGQDSGVTPNATPLPNPWAPPSSGAGQDASRGPGRIPAGLGLGAGLPGLAGGAFGGLGGAQGTAGAPGMDLGAMASMLQQNPQLSALVQQSMADGQLVDMAVRSNPQLQQMMDSMPFMRQMLSDPQTIQRLMNPETIASLMRLQGAMGNGGMPGMGNMPDVQNLMGALNGLGLEGAGLAGLMGMGAGMEAPAAPANPEQAFADQLTQLEQMGFVDRAANVRALVATGGNVHAAVDRLLSG